MKLRLLLCAIGLGLLGGCITTPYYTDDGYYQAPDDGYTAYDDGGQYGDGRYDDDGYYDAHNGGMRFNFSFNFLFGGYGGFTPYGNCWHGHAYCYGRHPRYGWGYWPSPYYFYYGSSYGWPNYGAWPGFGWPYHGGYHPPRPPKPTLPKPPKPAPIPPVTEPGDSDAPIGKRPVNRRPRPSFPETEQSERLERPRVREERTERPTWSTPPRSERPASRPVAPSVLPVRIERPVPVEPPRVEDDARGRAGQIERQQAPRRQQVRPAATPKAERPAKAQRSTSTADDEP